MNQLDPITLDPDGHAITKQRRKRGPNKPKVHIEQVKPFEGPTIEMLQAAAVAKAQRQFEDNWPFLSPDLRIDDTGALFGTHRFGNLEVSGRAPNAQRLQRDFREWARYQLWQKDRADDVVKWYKEDPEREEWLELASRPITRMDRPEPKKTR